MEPVPTVSLFDISPPRPSERALAEWRGFTEFRPGEAARSGRPALVLGDSPPVAWHWRAGLAPVQLRPIGCHFLRDVDIVGVGFPFSDGHYIREFSHTSDVGLQWLDSDHQPENPRLAPSAKEVIVAEPVLLVIGPGFPVFGHWLLDFLPRVVIAQRVLGEVFNQLVIPLPEDTPDWVKDMLRYFCGVPGSQIRTFCRETERLACSRVCLPSFAHNGNYALHGFVHEFYGSFRSSRSPLVKRRICLSRRNFEQSTRGVWRVFDNREILEHMALARGYEIVTPEVLSFADQIDLFQSAECIVGEHGSGMHSAVFAEPETLVADVPLWNSIQLRIGAAFGHRNVCVTRASVRRPASGPVHYTIPEEDLAGMFVMLDMLRSPGLATQVTVPGRPFLS
jgi:hypothetical protein